MFRFAPPIARRSARPGISLALTIFALAASVSAALAAGPRPVSLEATKPAIQTGQGSWRGRGPAGDCWGPAAIYDPIRHRMIAFGGQWGPSASQSFDVAWELSLDGPSSWTVLAPMGSGPWGRANPSMIYDPVRDRMIMFGGWGAVGFNDIWALSLSGVPTWTQITPAVGPVPAERLGHTAIYDPVRDRMIMFGGSGASNVDLNDTWALSLSGTPTWTQLAPTGTLPIARGWHTAIYDPLRDRMVIFAGWRWATSGSLADVMALSLSGTPAWSTLAATGSPLARNSHGAIYDPVGDRMVSYGGWHDPAHPADLTVLSLSGTPAWSTLTPSGTPPATRDGISLIYDAANQRIVAYAGLVDPADTGNVWAATLTGSPAWSAIALMENPAPGGNLLVRDPLRNQMVALTGTYSGLQIRRRTLGADTRWTVDTPSGPTPNIQNQYSVITDPVRDRLVLFGGSEEVWAYGLGNSTWSNITPSGTVPTPRGAHTAIYDAAGDRMVVYGGGFGSWEDFHEEIWALPLNGGSWQQIIPIGPEPIGRDGHTAIYDPVRRHMVICGGHDGFGTFRRDVWSFDLTTSAWTEIVPQAPLPADKVWFTAVYDVPNDRMLIFGGSNIAEGGQTNQLWALPLSGSPVWTQLDPPGAKPPARQHHGAIFDPVRQCMVVFGGTNYTTNFADIWEYTSEATVSVPDPVLSGGASLALAAPSPNPSRAMSTLAYTLASSGRVTLEVFDAAGRRVRRLVDETLPAGTHRAEWRGDDDRGSPVTSGLYFARLRLGAEQATQRILRLE